MLVADRLLRACSGVSDDILLMVDGEGHLDIRAFALDVNCDAVCDTTMGS